MQSSDYHSSGYANRQFHTLILMPILSVDREHFDRDKHIVLVLDALDECGDQDILQFLYEFLILPIRFRLFVSSRPQHAIDQKLLEMGSLVHKHDLGEDSSDIPLFVDDQLRVIKHKWRVDSRAWPGSEQQLVERTGGLFIWAATVVKFIDEDDSRERLSMSLESTASILQWSTPLKRLYLTVLNLISKDEALKASFHRVVGGILALAKPQSLSALGALLDDSSGLDNTCGMIQDVLSRLQSVIFSPDPLDNPLQPIHVRH
jgi:hypothetical protein